MTSSQTDRIDGVNTTAAIKVPVRVATTANIATLSGLLTVDGVTLVANDRVLVKDQTDTTQNGIYVAASTTWQRDADFDGARDVTKGTLIRVNEGSTWAGFFFALTTSGTISFGSSSITFATTGGPGSISAAMLPVTSAATLAAARAALGSGATGDALFAAATAAAARAILALGTAATQNTGTSGANVPLLNGANTWSAAQVMSALLTASLGITVTGAGIVAGAPTGGDKGAGSVNAQTLWVNGVQFAGFTKTFTSAAQGITLGGLITVAHSLGAVPFGIMLDLKCIDVGGEGGFIQNDIIQSWASIGLNDGTNARGASVYCDSTNVNIRVSNTNIVLGRKDTGVAFTLTPAKWNIIAKAFV